MPEITLPFLAAADGGENVAAPGYDPAWASPEYAIDIAANSAYAETQYSPRVNTNTLRLLGVDTSGITPGSTIVEIRLNLTHFSGEDGHELSIYLLDGSNAEIGNNQANIAVIIPDSYVVVQRGSGLWGLSALSIAQLALIRVGVRYDGDLPGFTGVYNVQYASLTVTYEEPAAIASEVIQQHSGVFGSSMIRGIS